MSKLYYEKQASRMHERFSSTPVESGKEYLEKISKSIPSKIIAVYWATSGLIISIKNEGLHQRVYYGVFAAGLIGTAWYLYYQSEQGIPKFIHVLMSCLTFLFWAFNISSDKIFLSFYKRAMASIQLIVFSQISGKISLNR